ncbi:MAG: PQQ-binding-like beta-propeller repeat protein [Thermoplasmatota archaeon]
MKMKRSWPLVVICVLILATFSPVVSSSLYGTPWGSFSNDHKNTGVSSFDTSGVNGSVEWNYSTEYHALSPVVGPEDNIYFVSVNTSAMGYVPGADELSNESFGMLLSLDRTGNLNWKFSVKGGFYTSPAVNSDGVIYIGSEEGEFYALNSEGDVKWSYSTGEPIRTPPTIGPHGTIYFGTRKTSGSSLPGSLYALYSDGTPKWVYSMDQGVASSPAVEDDGNVFISTLDGNITAIDPNGNEKWSYFTGNQLWSAPTIDSKGNIYVGTINGLVKLSKDGELKWQLDKKLDDKGILSSPSIGKSGTIYITVLNKNLTAVTPEGDIKWNYSFGHIGNTPSIGADETIYVGSYDKNVYSISSKGELKWTYETGDEVSTSPAIGSDGTVYVGSNDGKLYAFGSEEEPTPSDSSINFWIIILSISMIAVIAIVYFIYNKQ